MSNERSGFPGMAMAVTHLVSVVSGGVNVHAAFALVAANDRAATAPGRHASSLHRVVMDVSSHVDLSWPRSGRHPSFGGLLAPTFVPIGFSVGSGAFAGATPAKGAMTGGAVCPLAALRSAPGAGSASVAAR